MPSGEFLASVTPYSALMTCGADDEESGDIREFTPSCYTWNLLMSFPLATKHPPNQESDDSLPDSLFSKLSEASEARSHITEPPLTSTDTLARVSCSKDESTDALPDNFFNLLGHARELKCPLTPLLHLGDTSAQPTSTLPRIQFLDHRHPARRPPLDHSPSVITRALTGARDSSSPAAAAEQRSQARRPLNESSPGLILVSNRATRVQTPC